MGDFADGRKWKFAESIMSLVQVEMESVFAGWEDANVLKLASIFDPRTTRGYGDFKVPSIAAKTLIMGLGKHLADPADIMRVPAGQQRQTDEDEDDFGLGGVAHPKRAALPSKWELAVDRFIVLLNDEYSTIGRACRDEAGPEPVREEYMARFQLKVDQINPLVFWGKIDPELRAICPGFIKIVQRIMQRFASTARVESMWSYFRHVLSDERTRMLSARASRLNRSYVRDRLRRADLRPVVLPNLPVFGEVSYKTRAFEEMIEDEDVE